MNSASKGKVFAAVGLTITWAMVIGVTVFLFTRMATWPLDLTLLILLPIVVIWAPVSYFLAVAGNERYQRGEGLGLSSQVVARSALAGVLTGAISTITVWLYIALEDGFYFGSAVVVVLGFLCMWGVVHLLRQLVAAVRNAPKD